MMFKPVRIVATILLFAAFVMVWVSAFAINSAVSENSSQRRDRETIADCLYLRTQVLALVFVIVLWLAYLWYSLSYIPYARDMVKGAVSRVF